MKTKISTEVAHVTRDSDTIFKVKMSKVKVTGLCASRWWIVSTRLKISSNFSFNPVAHHPSF